jgi:hypothetical protein
MMKAIAFKRNLLMALTMLLVGAFGVPSNGLADLNDGLVGYWRFDEGSGSITYDETDNHNDGTIYGATWYDEGVSGSALSFDGDHDYVNLGNDASLYWPSMSITEWISFTDAEWMFTVNDQSPTNGAWGMSMGVGEDGHVSVGVCNGSGNDCMAATSQTALNDGEWHFVAGTYCNIDKTIKIYIDGEFNDEDSWASSLMHDPDLYDWIIGARSSSFVYPHHDPHWYKGLIDEVRIYDRALSEEEIEDLYNNPGGNQPPTAFIDDISPNPAELGQEVTFVGHGEDVDGSIVAYRWQSNIDGVFGTEASFSYSSLTVWKHTISFEVQDDDGEWSEKEYFYYLYIYDPNDFSIDWSYPDPVWMARFNSLVLEAEYLGGDIGGQLVYGLKENCLTDVDNYESDVRYPGWFFEQPHPWPWGTIRDTIVHPSYPMELTFEVRTHWAWIGDPWSLEHMLVLVFNLIPWGPLGEAFQTYHWAVKGLINSPQYYDAVITAVDGLQTVVNMDTYADVEYEGIGHSYSDTPFTIRWQVPPAKHGLWAASVVMQWPAALSSLLPVPWGWAVEVGIILASQVVYWAAYDPDSNYMELVNPEFIYPPELDSIEYLEARQIAYDLFTAVGYLEALKASFAKYQGALYYNDEEWGTAQLSAVQLYSEMAVQCLEPLLNFMDSNLVAPTPEQIDSMRNSFATLGLPLLEQSVLLQFGYTQEDIDQLADGLANLPDEYYYGTDSIPVLLQEAIYALDSLPDYFGELPGGARLGDLGIEPDSLNINDPPLILNCWVEFPPDSDLTGYQIISAVLNDTVEASYISPTPGDYDLDGIDDIAMQFDPAMLIPVLQEGKQLLSVLGDVILPSTDTVLYSGAAIITVIPFIRGDANGDGQVNLADAVYLVNWLFIGGPPPEPMEAGDANCDGGVDLADAVYIINYLFIGGPPPGC